MTIRSRRNKSPKTFVDGQFSLFDISMVAEPLENNWTHITIERASKEQIEEAVIAYQNTASRVQEVKVTDWGYNNEFTLEMWMYLPAKLNDQTR